MRASRQGIAQPPLNVGHRAGNCWLGRAPRAAAVSRVQDCIARNAARQYIGGSGAASNVDCASGDAITNYQGHAIGCVASVSSSSVGVGNRKRQVRGKRVNLRLVNSLIEHDSWLAALQRRQGNTIVTIKFLVIKT